MTGYKTDRHRTENGANSVAGRSHTSSFPIGQGKALNALVEAKEENYEASCGALKIRQKNKC